MGELDTVWSSKLSTVDGEAYDKFVAAARSGHYSQTRSWAKVATTARPFVARYFLARFGDRAVGAALILKTRAVNALTLPFAQVERGPVCDDLAEMPSVLEALHKQARRHGILRLSVMPYWAGEAKAQAEKILAQHGFAEAQSFGGRHARTLHLNLSSLRGDELFAGSALSQVRHEVRRAERAGATARRGQKRDLDAFREMHAQLLHLEGKRPPAAAWYEALGEYFLTREEQGTMFVCEYGEKIIAAIFVARHGTLATYVMGASLGLELRFPKMVLPLVKAIAWAKKNGIEAFDFGGIPLEGDMDVKRVNIAQFKRSFSRTEVNLVHEHVRWF